MIVTGDTISTLVTSANRNINALGGKTVIAFPDRYFSTPLKQTMFSLGVKKISVGPRLQITGSNGNVTTTRNRKVIITFSLNVYAPHSMGGEACLSGFDRWLDFLVRTLQMNIDDAGCREVEYEQSIGTNVLKGYFTLTRTVSETVPVE